MYTCCCSRFFIVDSLYVVDQCFSVACALLIFVVAVVVDVNASQTRSLMFVVVLLLFGCFVVVLLLFGCCCFVVVWLLVAILIVCYEQSFLTTLSKP